MVRGFTGDRQMELWRVADQRALAETVAQLRTNPAVEFAEPDYVVTINQILEPNDPLYVDQTLWGLRDTMAYGGRAADIDAPGGWAVRTDAILPGAKSVVVAVIDTGIRRTHEDLAGNMWENTGEVPGNGLDDDGNGYIDDRWGLNAITYTPESKLAGDPQDDYGHGTHVAGIIGAVGNNNKGSVGVAWQVKLMDVKFLNDQGVGLISDAVEAIDYARINGADVMNNSWGGSGYSQALLDAIQRAREAGIIFVAAAGNNGADTDIMPHYPSSYPVDNVVSVAASTRYDNLAYFSNYGLNSVDLAAPGESMTSTHFINDSDYLSLSGTSMAAPHVSGAFALMFAQFPDESLGRLINRVLGAVRPVQEMEDNVLSGGMLNLSNALRSTSYAPPNDRQDRAIRLALNTTVTGSTDGATRESGEPAHQGGGRGTVWYRFSPNDGGELRLSLTGTGAVHPRASVYLVGMEGTLITVAHSMQCAAESTAEMFVQAGRSYYIAVDGEDTPDGTFAISLERRPSNDDFANAMPITGSYGVVSVDASGATRQPGEPVGEFYREGGRSVWFKWQAPTSGRYHFVPSLQNSLTFPIVNFYTGSNLQTLADADAYTGHFYLLFGGIVASSGSVEVEAAAGQTYYIQVHPDSGVGRLGLLRLHWAVVPDNNSFASRRLLQGDNGSNVGDSRGAIPSDPFDDPSQPNTYGTGELDVWFEWTAPRSGWVVFDTLEDTDWDTTLEVFLGNMERGLVLQAANDDAGTLSQSAVAFHALAGKEYSIRLNGYMIGAFSPHFETPAGPYRLTWSMSESANDLNGDGRADVLFRNETTGEKGVISLMGATRSAARIITGIPSGMEVVGFGRFGASEQAQLLLQNPASGEGGIGYVADFAMVRFEPLPGLDRETNLVGASDFDGNGCDDIVIQNIASGECTVWMISEELQVDIVRLAVVGADWRLVAVGDFDGDGLPGVARENRLTGERAFWHIKNVAVEKSTSLGFYSRELVMVGAADLNGDGRDDLLFQNFRTGAVGGWLINNDAVQETLPLQIEASNWRLGGMTRSAPSCIEQPASKFAHSGDPVSFTAAFVGVPAAKLRWERGRVGSGTWTTLSDDGLYSGSSSSTLTILQVQLSMSGDRFRCVAVNDLGRTVTQGALLEVRDADADGVSTIPGNYAPGRLIVKFKRTQSGDHDTGATSAREIRRAELRSLVGATLVRQFKGDQNLELWNWSSGMSLSSIIGLLRAHQDVAFAEPDFKITIDQVVHPTDPSYPAQWGLNNTGESWGLEGADIDAPEGWGIRTDAILPNGDSVVVAVLDSGIRRTHEDLAANTWENASEVPRNGIDDDNNGYIDDRWGFSALAYSKTERAGDPDDDNGHGTHVAGIIGAVAGNGTGVAGVAWRVELMAVKMLDEKGEGNVSDAVEALDYARINGAHIVNASWTGMEFSHALFEAVLRTEEAGILIAAAAGNSSADSERVPLYPASYLASNVVSVAASDRFDQRAWFSAWGYNSVTIAAPGYQIFSTGNENDSHYEEMSGTSMAAPHVAGALALLKASYPDEAPAVMSNRLVRSARQVPAFDGMVRAGGVLNLRAALDASDTSPLNDHRANAIWMKMGRELLGNNYGATLEVGEPFHADAADGKSVWYALAPASSGPVTLKVNGTNGFLPVIAVYQSGGSTPVGERASNVSQATLTLDLEAGRSYVVAISGADGTVGSFTMLCQITPRYDNFFEPLLLEGEGGRAATSAIGVSMEDGEPQFWSQEHRGGSIWLDWTAPRTAEFTFNAITQRASGVVYLVFYTGEAPNSLTQTSLTGMNWGGFDSMQSSQVQLQATAGTRYRLQLWVSSGADIGDVKLSWMPTPTNDDWENAAAIAGADGELMGDSRGANAQFQDNIHGYGEMDVWFDWVAPRNGTVSFTTVDGASWDTTLEAYIGSAPSSATRIAANDDAAGSLQSRLRFVAVAGAIYRIRLNGYTLGMSSRFVETPAGPYTLRWSMARAPDDVDGDGLSDLILSNLSTNEHRISLRDGGEEIAQISFEQVEGYHLVAIADFNGDHRGDLAFQNHSSGAIRIGLMDSSAPHSFTDIVDMSDKLLVDAADFDGDGTPDLLVYNRQSQEVGIRLMDGTAPVGYVVVGQSAHEWNIVGAGDCDGDGHVDILRANTTTRQWQLWAMNGVEKITELNWGSHSSQERVAALHDYNGDGRSDVLIYHTLTGSYSVGVVDGGTIQGQVAMGSVAPGWAIGGTAPAAPSVHSTSGDRRVRAGTDTSFSVEFVGIPRPAVRWQVSSNNGVTWNDLSDDGRYMGVSTDTLRLTNAGFPDNNQLYRCVASNLLASDVACSPLKLKVTLPTADFNDDDDPDIVWQNSSTGERIIWMIDALTQKGQHASLGVVPPAWRIAATGDFNADGQTDLLWTNTTDGQCGFWLMKGAVLISDFVYLASVSPDWQIAAAADFDGDGRPDIVWQNRGTGETGFWLMDGTALRGEFVSLGTTSIEWEVRAAGDFNGDGRNDLLFQNILTGACEVRLLNGTNPLGEPIMIGIVSNEWVIASAGDYNGDGHTDILWQNFRTGQRGFWVMEGTKLSGDFVHLAALSGAWEPPRGGVLSMPPIFESQPIGADVRAGSAITLAASVFNAETLTLQWFKDGVAIVGATQSQLTIPKAEWPDAGRYYLVASNSKASVSSRTATVHVRPRLGNDFNGDGRSDLIWQNALTGERQLWLMDGYNRIGEPVQLGHAAVDWTISSCGDFNGDGHPDLLWENTESGVRGFWIMNGTVPRGDFLYLDTVPPEWRIAACADFDGDGQTDIIWENTVSGRRGLWLMEGTRRRGDFVDVGTVPIEWRIVAAADMDLDSKPDLFWQHQTQTWQWGLWPMDGTTQKSGFVAYAGSSMPITGAGDYNGDGAVEFVAESNQHTSRAFLTGSGTFFYIVQEAEPMSAEWRVGEARIMPLLAPKVDPSWGSMLSGRIAEVTSIGVGVSGTPPFTYEWSKDGQPAGRGTTSTYTWGETTFIYLTLENVNWTDAGVYQLTISNAVGSTTSPQIRFWVRTKNPGDFNNDGKPDLIWQNANTGQRVLWFMNGTEQQGAYQELGWAGTDWAIVGADDFNGDGQCDLVWQNKITGQCGFWLLEGHTLKGGFVHLGTVSSEWQIVATADFDRDGRPDLLWQNDVSGECGVWLMDETRLRGGFVHLMILPPQNRIVALADWSGELAQVLVWENPTTGDRGAWSIDEALRTWNVPLEWISPEWRIVGMADHNGDYSKDLVLENSVTGERGIWPMLGSQRIGEMIPIGTLPTEWKLGY